jgi:uncharacterized membrane protein YkvA (DUF1232 family)
MRPIDRDFVARGAARVTQGDVARVFDNADAIGAKLEGGRRLTRFVDDAKLLLALVRDYWTREYRTVPYWVIGAAVFTLLYVLAPFDLIPDAIPGIGQLDDAAVVSVCLALVRQELTKYAAWRESRNPR